MENNNQRSISTVAELKEVFDCLNSPCSTYCSKCSDLDCAGYIWLLPEEAGVLLEHEVEIIEVNRNTRFINSFSREDGTLDLSRSYPNCVYQCEETRKCLIREIRPLTCHMYPIGPETICGNDGWICHCDCEFVRHMVDENTIDEYISKVKNVLNQIDKELYSEIVRVYKDMCCVMDSSEQIDGNYIFIQNM